MTDPHPDPHPTDSARDARGRFQPGQSGNPAGKKPGTLNHATRLKRLLADDQYDVVARQLIDAATAGHMPSVRFLMERLVPKPRGRAIALDLPSGASRTARLTALVDQMCAGEISADEAKAMIAIIDVADRAAAQPVAGLHSPCISEPAAAAGDATAGGVDGDAALHSTCISNPGAVMPGLDLLDPDIVTDGPAAAAQAPVTMSGSSRSTPAMTGWAKAA